MQIDWFTFGAQIVNFVILVLLLKHFLYDRIVAAMDARERRIAEHLDEAQEKEKAAERRQAELRRQKEELEGERQAILRSAREKAEKQHAEESRRLRDDIQARRQRWVQSLERERGDFLKALRRESGRQVCAVSRHALHELADQELHAQIVSTLIEKLEALDEEKTKPLAKAVRDNDGTLHVRSSHALSDDAGKRLQEAVEGRLDMQVEIHATEDDDLLCGLELSAGGHRLAWSLDHHLDRLEENLVGLLDHPATRGNPDREEGEGESGEQDEPSAPEKQREQVR